MDPRSLQPPSPDNAGMPTLNWRQRDAAFRAAEAVPHRLLQPVAAHGDGDARNCWPAWT